MKQYLRFLCYLVVCAFLLASCATTSLTAVWKDPSFEGPIKKIAVIGIFRTPAVRNLFEDEFVGQLRGHGVEAAASYTFIPIDELSDQGVITAKLEKLGIDKVLVTRLVDKRTVQSYVPGQVYAVPGYYRSWGGYHRYVYTPGYIVEDTYAFAETNIYEVKNDRLIWSARSETQISGAKQELIQSFVKIMSDRLSADGLVR